MTLVHDRVNRPMNTACVEVFDDMRFFPWHKTTTFFNGDHSAFDVQTLVLDQLEKQLGGQRHDAGT